MSTPGIHDFVEWNIPEEYWALFSRIQSDTEEDEKLQLIKCHKAPRCSSCGKFMDLHNAYFNVSVFGRVHIKEKCITKILTRVRKEYSFWDWSI